ncbi:DUF484 family protein [Vibrio sp. qd031]|uniref:DUF484 family protein n=1 Tax=Vibrio sp. qd031 TaxID=1603038 RepID=UPI00117D31E0|nr:DUF484 family protein [Vibrio sp. qd031]
MSRVNTQNQPQEPLSTEETDLVVAEYLEQHPGFFERHPELLERLNIQAKDTGTVSLSGIQLQRQRKRIQELEEEVTDLMSLASANDKTFNEFMSLQQQVLSCERGSDVINAIATKARDLKLTAHVALVGSEHLPLSAESWHRFQQNNLHGKSAYLGRLKQGDRSALFDTLPSSVIPELGSYVILPLDKAGLQGCLVFASEDGGHFRPEQDTLFLRHLALVTAHMLADLPWK